MDVLSTLKTCIGKMILGASFDDKAGALRVQGLPFYGFIIYSMMFKEEDLPNSLGLATCFKNGRMLLAYDLKRIDEVISRPAATVLALMHEINHHVLGHTTFRIPQVIEVFANPQMLWNIAADLAVNSMLEYNYGISKYIDNIVIPGKGAFIDYPKDLSVEEYFKLLIKNKPKIGGGSSGGKDSKNDSNGSQQDNITINGVPYKVTPFEPTKDPLSEATLKELIKDSLMKSKGVTPGELASYVDIMLKSKPIPWKAIIRQWLTATVRADSYKTRRRDNRREDELPGRRHKKIAKVMIAVDTSGSIEDKDLALFKKTMLDLSRATPQNSFWMIECDTIIQNVTKIDKFKIKNKREWKGRGGTDFRPVFEYVEKKAKGDILIFFTDLYGTFPEKRSRIPTLWLVVNNNEAKVPFGKVIKLKKEDI